MDRESLRSQPVIYVGVLDLRVRRRTLLQNGLLLDTARDSLTAYCVLRLGDQHHRTPSFPPEGLEEVPVRRTIVDDKRCEEGQAFDENYGAGVFWESPASWVASKNDKLTSQPGLEWEWSELQDQKRPQREGSARPHVMEDDRDSCGCPAESLLLLEFYNDANAGHSGEPIEGFEAEALGVLRVNLLEFLMPNFDEQPADHFDAPEDVLERRSSMSCVGANRRNDGIGPGLAELRPHAQTCTQDGTAKSWRCRKERWVGGVVHPTPGSHQDRHEADPSSRGFVVEARLQMTWGVDGVTWSQRPVYDSFGQAVDPRNVNKCSSAEGLWSLQEPSRKARWRSEAGREAWSALTRNGRYTEVPQARYWPNIPTKNSEQDRGDVLRELVWTGVPADMREEVYMSLSGATSKRELCGDGYYKKLLSDCAQMGNDCPRDGEHEPCTLILDQKNENEELPNSWTQDAGTAVCNESDSAAQDPSASSLPKPHRGCGEYDTNDSLHSGRTRSSHYPQEDSFDQSTRCMLSSLSGKVGVEEAVEGCTRTTAATSSQLKSQDQLSQHTIRVWQEIEADLERVFINGRTRVNTPAGAASMRRVLRAYSLRNLSVGYCQGMNFVVGLLLQVVSEEAAFWLLAAYCEDLHPDYHTKSMLRARSDIAALKDIVRRELPRFHARAGEVGMPLELKLTQWLVVGFINCFPAHAALRVLEISFIEGSDVSLATAVAFLRLHEVEILKGEDIAEVVCTLDRAQSGMYETDILLAQVWRELAVVGPDIRAARAWHLNLMLRSREAMGNGRLQECKTLDESTKDNRRIGEDTEAERGGWLRGRSSAGAGSAWLFLVPEALSGQVEAMLTTLNRKAFMTTHNLFVDGKLARTSFAPLIVGGVRWLMGWRTKQ